MMLSRNYSCHVLKRRDETMRPMLLMNSNVRVDQLAGRMGQLRILFSRDERYLFNSSSSTLPKDSSFHEITFVFLVGGQSRRC